MMLILPMVSYRRKLEHPELVAFEEAKENLATMLAAVQKLLSISDYTPESVEQFGELRCYRQS